MNILKMGTALVPAVLAIALATGPAAALNGKPAVDKETIVMALSKEIGNLDAQVTATGDSQRYGWQMFDTLYALSETGELVPHLATGLTISPDGLSYTFKLRTDVKFHNGATMTSADVKYSMERILDPAVKSTRRPALAAVLDRVEAPDASTVVFHLKVKDGAFLNKIVGYLFIVPKAYTESLPTPEAFANAPIGTGAFKFVERKLGQSVTLERFDDYFGPKPKIKRIIFRIIEEPSSRVNALLTGEVDITDGIPSVDVERLKATQGVAVMPTPIASPLAVRIYSNDPKTPFHDRRVRLALNYALDTNSLIKNVLHGVGAPLSSYISSFYSIGTDKNLKPYEYNPAKAKQLLKEAGYPKGFETSLYSPSDMPKDIAETIAAYWSQVGIQTKIQRIDYAAWSRLNNTHKSSPLTVMQFSNAIFDPIHPVAGAASTKGTWSDYSNPEVDKLLAQVNETPDRAERDRLFKQVGKILHDDGHAVLLTELYYIFGKDSKINWEPRSGISWYDLRGASWQ